MPDVLKNSFVNLTVYDFSIQGRSYGNSNIEYQSNGTIKPSSLFDQIKGQYAWWQMNQLTSLSRDAFFVALEQ